MKNRRMTICGRNAILTSLLIVFLVFVSVNIVIFSDNHIIVGDELYSMKSTDITLDFKKKNFTYDNLKDFSNLYSITIINATYDDIIHLPNLSSVIEVNVMFSEVCDRDILSRFTYCKVMDCFRCSYLFSGDVQTNLMSLSLEYCNIYNIKNASRYEKLKYLSIWATNYQGRNYIINNDSPFVVENGQIVLIDSSIFRAFESIEVLSLYKIHLNDVSGIISMNNIQELHISKGAIDEYYKSILSNNNILIIETKSDKKKT